MSKIGLHCKSRYSRLVTHQTDPPGSECTLIKHKLTGSVFNPAYIDLNVIKHSMGQLKLMPKNVPFASLQLSGLRSEINSFTR